MAIPTRDRTDEGPPARREGTTGSIADRRLLAVWAAAAVAAGVARFVVPTPLAVGEALDVRLARLPLGDLPAALEAHASPPLHHVLLHVWTGVFGEGLHAVRAFSALCSILLVPVAWGAARRFAGERSGWIAAMVVALSPWGFLVGSEVGPYALLTLELVAGALMVARVVDRPSVLRLAGLVAVTAAAAWTHYWSLGAIGIAAAVLSITLLRHRAADRRPRGAAVALRGLALGTATLLPWVARIGAQLDHAARDTARARPATVALASLLELAGGPGPYPYLLLIVTLVLVGLGLTATQIDGFRTELDLRVLPAARVPGLVAAATGVVLIAVTALAGTEFLPRHAAVLFGPVALLTAMGLARVERPPAREVALGVVGVLSVLAIQALFTTDRIQTEPVAAVLRREAPASVVVACPAPIAPALAREVPSGTDVVAYPGLATAAEVTSPHPPEATDPAADAAWILEMAGERTVVVVFATGDPLTAQCQRLADSIAASRPADVLVRGAPRDFLTPLQAVSLSAP